MHHNATPVEELTYGSEMRYITGLKDICAVFFYTLIAVVVHAVIQEYLLDVSWPFFFSTHLLAHVFIHSICCKILTEYYFYH